MRFLCGFVILFVFLGNAFAQVPTSDYRNPHLPIEQRVADLLKRMTLEEKVGQLTIGRRNGLGVLDTTGKFNDTTARQACHLGFGVEFLSDATGTLDFKNEAGAVSAEELHRATLVTQQMRFSRVLPTQEWLKIL